MIAVSRRSRFTRRRGRKAVRRRLPAPRLVLVTAETMHDTARNRLSTASRGRRWRALGARSRRDRQGRHGLVAFFLRLARRGEPIKVEGDKRAPAGIYRIGRSFGIVASSRPDYLHVTEDTICVDDPSSPAYNTIASRASVEPKVHAREHEPCAADLPPRPGVNYPTDAEGAPAVHLHSRLATVERHRRLRRVARGAGRSDAGFRRGGAVIAILPRGRYRLPGLPASSVS